MKKWAFILLGLVSFNVYANCPGQFDPRSGICSFQGNDGRLIQYNSAPPQSGTVPHPRKTIRNVYIPSKYGALTINLKTSISGGALNMNSLTEAKKEAIRVCEMGGKNAPCEIVSSIRNGCIAVAQGELKGKVRTFYAGKERGLAEPDALNQCKGAGVKDCRITIPEGCSLPDGM